MDTTQATTELTTVQLQGAFEAADFILDMADLDDKRVISAYGRLLITGAKITSVVAREFLTTLYRCLPASAESTMYGMDNEQATAFENAVARQVFKLRNGGSR